ncbi:MAG: ketopantoate reductase family protein [Promethearchaeota archaeon]
MVKVAIFGAGAIGSLFAAYFRNAGIAVGVVARGAHGDVLVRRGLTLKRAYDGREMVFEDIDVIREPSRLGDYPVVVLSVKTYDLEGVMGDFKEHGILDEDAHVLCILQNGLGNEAVVRRFYSRIPIIRFITSNGAMMPEPGTVIHTGEGRTFIGIHDENGSKISAGILDRFHDALKYNGLHVEISNEIARHVWGKAIINCGINAVGAMYRVKNGEILRNPILLEISRKIVGEAIKVARARGELEDPGYDGWMEVRRVMERTRENRNSMLQDIEKGRKTEINFINGIISKLGSEIGIETPWNDAITLIIQGFETLNQRKEKKP